MKIIFCTLFVFQFLACISQNAAYLFSYFKGNGEDGLHLAFSYDAMTWSALNHDHSFLKPEVGESKLMRDPCIIKGKDRIYHMVWTAGWTEKGIGYASSKDLLNWSQQKYLPLMEHELTARNAWAPEVTYDKKRKGYVIYWASTIPGRFAETESSGDKGYNHRIYYVFTNDFKKFTDSKLLFDKGFNAIDGTIQQFKNEYLMFVKDETRYPPAKNIRTMRSKELEHWSSSPVSSPITGNYWAEGPTCIRVGKKHIVYFDKYTEHRMGAIESDDLVNWKDISDAIHFPDGVRHGTVIKISKNELNRLIQFKSPQ